MTDDLVAWLREQVDEDERVAWAATKLARWIQAAPGEVVSKYGDETFVVAVRVQSWNAAHIARHDPARVLAEVAAKRAILAAYELWQNNPSGEMRDYGHEEGLEEALLHLAAVYAGRPGYRAEWAPEPTEQEESSRGRR